MADIRNFQQTGARTGVAVDQGLRAYMLKVYNYMAVGLGLTGIAAYATYHLAVQAGQLTSFGEAIFIGPAKWLVIFAPLALVFFMSFRLHTLSVGAAQAVFWIYAAMMGISFGSLGLIYTGASIARVFMITAVAFGSLSVWGYTTKRDLTGWGSFLFMGLMGMIVASLVGIFFHSSAMNFALSIIGVLVFTGFTAYDTQAIKETYYEGDGTTVMGHKAIMGALRLYLDFVNLFLSLLRLFGNRN